MLHKYDYFFSWKLAVKLHIHSPSSTHIPILKEYPHNLTKYESKKNTKIPIFHLISELGKIWKYIHDF